jgi:hypothetical protein
LTPDKLKKPSMSIYFENNVVYEVIKTQYFIIFLIIAKDFSQNPLPQYPQVNPSDYYTK